MELGEEGSIKSFSNLKTYGDGNEMGMLPIGAARTRQGSHLVDTHVVESPHLKSAISTFRRTTSILLT
jgi:hypothetical protein